MSLRVLVLSCLAVLCGCADPALDTPEFAHSERALAQSVVYVGKTTTTDFRGLGQHLQYWPLFGLTTPTTRRRTDDPACIELTPDFASFNHHYLPPGRTFSNDALGIPIGTKTRGGEASWATFTLPDGTVGLSGTFYDESNIDNSNNTVNQMRINVPTLHEFCLNLITDNTTGEHNPTVRFEARSDTVDVNMAGHPDHTFDGQTDMYTFRYRGMVEDDVFKVRLQCTAADGCEGAGLGGIMVSHISTCTPAPEDGGIDAGSIDASDPIDAGEVDSGQPQDLGSPDVQGTPDLGGGPDAASPDGSAQPDAMVFDSGAVLDLGSGLDAATAPDTGAADAANPSDNDDGGCGCRSTAGAPAMVFWAGLVFVGFWRRRRVV